MVRRQVRGETGPMLYASVQLIILSHCDYERLFCTFVGLRVKKNVR